MWMCTDYVFTMSGSRWDFHIKMTGMLIIPLRGKIEDLGRTGRSEWRANFSHKGIAQSCV